LSPSLDHKVGTEKERERKRANREKEREKKKREQFSFFACPCRVETIHFVNENRSNPSIFLLVISD